MSAPQPQSAIDTPMTDSAEQLVKGPNAWSPFGATAVATGFARELERENRRLRESNARLVEATTDRRYSYGEIEAACGGVVATSVHTKVMSRRSAIAAAKEGK